MKFLINSKERSHFYRVFSLYISPFVTLYTFLLSTSTLYDFFTFDFTDIVAILALANGQIYCIGPEVQTSKF
jgi:hypothetical protein